MDILRIKDENGVWQNVPALVGPPGKNGAQGEPGPAGSDGYTPVRGTDYWTAADQAQIVQDVLAALPEAEEVSV